VQEKIKAAYTSYTMAEIVQLLLNFCSVDLGSLYLDVTKDRLYTMPVDSRGRRSAQTAMYHIAEAFTRWIAPILSFTADELWGYLPGARKDNVLFATWYDGLAPLPADAPLTAADFEQLLALREQVSKVLEPMRANGAIGAALEAEITVAADADTAARWQPLADELRFLLISGDVQVRPATTDEVFVSAQPTGKTKCVRCWHYRADVGTVAAHPELCGRCVTNIDGAGEDRRWF
jgi:isoleucyl-tRNA synthetase